MNEDFVDLRRGNLSSESFWPSFTDIMMVVVIIFLLTSMLLMVKNWELLDQLRNSMAAEEQAVKIIKDTSQENATLEEQLAAAQDEVAMLRMQMMQRNEQNNQLASELEDRDRQLLTASSENQRLKNIIDDKDSEITGINARLSDMQDDLAGLNTDIEKTNEMLLQEREKSLVLSRERDSQSRQLTKLEDDFGSLKVKYDKLIKPARSASGKQVVTVDYERIKGKERIRFKGPGDSDYSLVSKKQLHSKLAGLKKKYPKTLYVRIIIPEKSGLTYNEAWAFMRGLLQKYDYYYQD